MKILDRFFSTTQRSNNTPKKPETDTHTHIRWMIIRDIPEILGINSQNSNPDEQWSEQQYIDILRERTIVGKVVERGEKIIGYCIYRLHDDFIEVIKFEFKESESLEPSSLLIEKMKSKLKHRRCKLVFSVPQLYTSFREHLEQHSFTKCNPITKSLLTHRVEREIDPNDIADEIKGIKVEGEQTPKFSFEHFVTLADKNKIEFDTDTIWTWLEEINENYAFIPEHFVATDSNGKLLGYMKVERAEEQKGVISVSQFSIRKANEFSKTQIAKALFAYVFEKRNAFRAKVVLEVESSLTNELNAKVDPKGHLTMVYSIEQSA